MAQVKLTIQPLSGAAIILEPEIPDDGIVISDLMTRVGRDSAKLNFRVRRPKKRGPGVVNTSVISEPNDRVEPGSEITAFERPAGS